MMTAAMTVSSKPVPALAWAVPRRAAARMPGEAGRGARQDVDDDRDAVDVDADQPRGLAIAADREDLATESKMVEGVVRDERE